jgi:hypothetical protein
LYWLRKKIASFLPAALSVIVLGLIAFGLSTLFRSVQLTQLAVAEATESVTELPYLAPSTETPAPQAGTDAPPYPAPQETPTCAFLAIIALSSAGIAFNQASRGSSRASASGKLARPNPRRK